jgi:cell division protein FtsW (lipid II flippase)
MNDTAITAYLDAVCTHVRLREVHPAIRQELADHIADCADHLQAQGVPEENALREAIARMGDPESVGRELDQAHRLRTDWGLLAGVGAMVAVGLWAMWAVTVSQSYAPFDFFGRQLVWLAAGTALGASLFFLDYRRLERLAWPAFAVVTGGILLMDRHGMGPWQALMPLLLTLSLAGIFARWRWQAWWTLPGAMLLLVLPMGLLYGRNEVFGALEYAFGFTVLFLAARPRRRQIALYAALATAGATIAVPLAWAKPYLRMRIEALLFPWRDPQSIGYAAVQSRLSIHAAGLWGRGALARLQDLPEVHRNYIFPYLVYTLGWVAGAAVAGLALYFVIRLLRLAQRIRDPFGKALVYGASAILIFRVLYNLLMALGLLPAAGITLPLVSYGPEQVGYLAALGLVLSVYRRKDLAGLNQAI